MTNEAIPVSLTDHRDDVRPTLAHILSVWWPLAVSQLLMVLENVIVVAVVARLADPEISLAALGGIVSALTSAIASPILMFHTASATLCVDRPAYRNMRKYVLSAMVLFTGLHALIALTPLYGLVASGLIGAPDEILQPGQWGLVCTLAYLPAVAYRQLHQGVLIRFGRSGAIARGTVLRLLVDGAVLAAGYAARFSPGIVVGGVMISAGVAAEAIYVTAAARPLIERRIGPARSRHAPPTLKSFLRLYVPLAMTSVALLVMRLVGSGALSRMREPIGSLAVWSPVFNTLLVLSLGGSVLIQVVVSMMDRPWARESLHRFARRLALCTAAATVLVTATPVGAFWFSSVCGLGPDLAVLARAAMWIAILYPPAMVFNGLYLGMLTHARRTRPILEAVVVSSAVSLTVFVTGVIWNGVAGIYIGVAALTVSSLAQTSWLWYRTRSVTREQALPEQRSGQQAGGEEGGSRT